VSAGYLEIAESKIPIGQTYKKSVIEFIK